MFQKLKFSQMSIIGATTARSRRAFPDGYPKKLVSRGLGQVLYDRLDELGQPCKSTVAVVVIHLTSEGMVAGPQLCLRGPTFTLGLTPKRIWGQVCCM